MTTLDDRARVVSTGAGLRLLFPWPGDFIYRPMVGVFEQGGLKNALPAYRVPPSTPAGDWDCAIDVKPEWLNGRGQSGDGLFFLENARKIWPLPSEGSPETVGELINQVTTAPRDDEGSDFLSFLRLGLLDQLSILQLCVKGNSCANLIFEEYGPAIARGEMTILDARDALFQADGRALPAGADSSLRSPFRWLVWSGGEKLLDVLRKGSAGANRIVDQFYGTHFPDDMTAAQFTDYVARCAVGPSDPSLRKAWSIAHELQIAAAFTKFRSVDEQRSSSGGIEEAPPQKTRYRNLLASMSVGGVGRRQQRREEISARPGCAGVILFGPYWSLPTGFYSLTLDIVTTGPVVGAPSSLWLEAVVGDLLVAWMPVGPAETGASRYQMEFDLSRGRGTAGEELEFRLRTEGEWGGSITGMALERLAGRPQFGSRPRDLFPALISHSAVTASGARLGASAVFEGHLFWGPYRALPPGKYLLQLTATLPQSFGLFKGHLEVISQSGDLKRHSVELRKEAGKVRAEIEFQIRDADRKEKIEFRMWKSMGSAIVVESVELRQVD